MARLTRTYQ